MPSKAEVYPIALSQKLPTIKIPLRPQDAEVPLELQPLIDQCYRKGRYEGTLDYRRDPEPPLSGPESEWVVELLRGHGLRPAKRKRRRRPPRASDDA